MTLPQMPAGLTPRGGTPEFTEKTLPGALKSDHSLPAGRWGRLHVLEGRVIFIDDSSGERYQLVGPCEFDIPPQAVHHLELDGPLTCRVDFFGDEIPARPDSEAL